MTAVWWRLFNSLTVVLLAGFVSTVLNYIVVETPISCAVCDRGQFPQRMKWSEDNVSGKYGFVGSRVLSWQSIIESKVSGGEWNSIVTIY